MNDVKRSRLKTAGRQQTGGPKTLHYGRIPLGALALTTGLYASLLMAAEPPSTSASVELKGAFQSQAVTPSSFQGDIRNLPQARPWMPGDPITIRPKRQFPRPGSGASGGQESGAHFPDPLLDLQASAPMSVSGRGFSPPDLNFEGSSFTGVFPPDTVGEIGALYYIQMVNDAAGAVFTVYDKTSGATVAGPTVLDSLWTAGGACNSGFGDPIVLYDALASRWLMSEFASSGNHLCVYVSKTADPLAGGWWLYDFSVPQFPDYHKYAVWPDAYYVSTNESNPAAYALDRTRMLSGLPATFQRFTAPGDLVFPFQALTPSDLDGPAAPPAGSPAFFMRHRDDEAHDPGSSDPTRDFLEIWEYHVDFANPALSTFSGPLRVEVSEFDSELCGFSAFRCFPQPGTGTRLDPLREVVMWRLQYRNFGSHESLIGNFVTDASGSDQGGIRWFELRKSAGSNWTLFQEGTFSPDQESRWMGSVAMDKDGNLALGYSVSSSSVFPSIRYAGRLAADPPGTLPQGEVSVVEGSFSQGGITRWGDYSSMNVDPVDDCTFWYTNEYVATPSGNWSTRIASFAFPSCTGQATVGGAVTGVDADFAVCRNQATAQTVPILLQGDTSWDCESAGLAVGAGDTVNMFIGGSAATGVPSVGGSVTGIDTVFAVCRNQTTGQTVPVLLQGETSYDCEASGLTVSPGDTIRLLVSGQVN